MIAGASSWISMHRELCKMTTKNLRKASSEEKQGAEVVEQMLGYLSDARHRRKRRQTYRDFTGDPTIESEAEPEEAEVPPPAQEADASTEPADSSGGGAGSSSEPGLSTPRASRTSSEHEGAGGAPDATIGGFDEQGTGWQCFSCGDWTILDSLGTCHACHGYTHQQALCLLIIPRVDNIFAGSLLV